MCISVKNLCVFSCIGGMLCIDVYFLLFPEGIMYNLLMQVAEDR